jgi:phosphatidate cytidylyltransferase
VNNLKTRVITAIIFGIVLIGAIFLSPYSLVVLCLFISTYSVFEFNTLIVKHKDSSLDPYLQSSISAAFFLLAIFSYWDIVDQNDAFVIFPVILINISFVLFNRNAKPLIDIGGISLQLIFLTAPLLLLCITSLPKGVEGEFKPWMVMSFFILIWASDIGAYFTGKYLGKRKLFERISPKKTLEGFLGGVVLSAIAGYLLAKYNGVFSIQKGIILGVIMASTGTIGDLVESMIKRELGVKDSGNILPGHGGFLDRFDSTFFAAPFYFFIVMFR